MLVLTSVTWLMTVVLAPPGTTAGALLILVALCAVIGAVLGLCHRAWQSRQGKNDAPVE